MPKYHDGTGVSPTDETPRYTSPERQVQAAPVQQQFVSKYHDGTGIKATAFAEESQSIQDLDHDNLYKDKEFIAAAKRYYWNRQDESFGVGEESDKAVADYFISDQRWIASNTFRAGERLAYITNAFGDGASDDDMQDLGIMLDRWDRLPDFIERVGDGDVVGAFGAVASNLWRGAVDPTMYAGSILGKAAAGKVIGEGIKEVARRRMVQVGTSLVTDAALTGGFDYLSQQIQVKAGLRDEVNMWQAATVGALGGAMSGAGAYYLAAPVKPKFKNALEAAQQAIIGEEKLRGKVQASASEVVLGGTKQKVKDAIGEANEVLVGKPIARAVDAEDAFPITNGKSFAADNVNRWREVVSEAEAPQGTMTSMTHLLSDIDPSLGTVAPEVAEQTLRAGRELQNKSLSGEFSIESFSPEELIAEIRVLFKPIMDHNKRGVVSKAETIANANAKIKASGGDAVGMVAGRKPGDPIIAEDVIIAKIAANALMTKAQGIRRQMATATGDDLDNLALQYGESFTAALDVARKGDAMVSEAGRALNASKFEVAVENFAFSTAKNIRKTLDSAMGLTKNTISKAERTAMDREYAHALSMLDPNNKLQHELFMSNLENADLKGMFWETWYNSLLSGPATMGINTIGNMATGALDNLERLVAGTAKAAFGGDTAMLRESVGQIIGQAAAMKDAFQVAARTYMTELPFDPKTRLEGQNTASIASYWLNPNRTGIKDMFRSVGKGEGGIGGRQIRIPGRILMATDDFFKIIHTRGYMYSQGIKEADALGLKGKDLVKFISEDFMPRAVADSGMMKRAVEHGRRLTYTEDPGAVGRAISTIAEEVPGARLFLPFVRTPANILRFAAERIPGIHRMSRTAADLKAGGEVAALGYSRLALGTATMSIGAMMAYNGSVIGPAPTDPALRNTFDTANKMPWSVKVGDQWIQWNRLDPIAIPFAMGAGMKSILDAAVSDEDKQSVAEAAVVLLSDAMLDKSWFQGVQNVVGAMADPNRKGHALGMSVSRTTVPSVMAAATRAYNPVTTAPMTVVEAIQDRARFDRGEVAPKVNALGFESEYEVAGTGKGDRGVLSSVNRMVNPFKAKTAIHEGVSAALEELRYGLAKPSKRQFGINLSSGQYYTYSKARGNHMYNIMKWAVESPNWDKLHKGQQRDMFDYAKKEASAIAAQALLFGYPETFGAKFRDTKQFKNYSKLTKKEVEMRLGGVIPKLLGRDEE